MTDYNIVNLPIDNGLKNEEISSGRNYLILLESPSNANVKVRFNGTTTDQIPLKENFAINCANAKTVHISCDAVAGGKIVLGQSNTKDALQIFPVPSLEFSDEILDNLRFSPNGSAQQELITAGSFYEFAKAGQTAIRFVADNEEMGVEFNNNGIKYPMYEDIIYLNSINTIKFHNDNAFDINLKILDM